MILKKYDPSRGFGKGELLSSGFSSLQAVMDDVQKREVGSYLAISEPNDGIGRLRVRLIKLQSGEILQRELSNGC